MCFTDPNGLYLHQLRSSVYRRLLIGGRKSLWCQRSVKWGERITIKADMPSKRSASAKVSVNIRRSKAWPANQQGRVSTDVPLRQPHPLTNCRASWSAAAGSGTCRRLARAQAAQQDVEGAFAAVLTGGKGKGQYSFAIGLFVEPARDVRFQHAYGTIGPIAFAGDDKNTAAARLLRAGEEPAKCRMCLPLRHPVQVDLRLRPQQAAFQPQQRPLIETGGGSGR